MYLAQRYDAAEDTSTAEDATAVEGGDEGGEGAGGDSGDGDGANVGGTKFTVRGKVVAVQRAHGGRRKERQEVQLLGPQE